MHVTSFLVLNTVVLSVNAHLCNLVDAMVSTALD